MHLVTPDCTVYTVYTTADTVVELASTTATVNKAVFPPKRNARNARNEFPNF